MSQTCEDTVLVCQGCRFGCVLGLSFDEEATLIQVDGYSCNRGHQYALAWVANQQGAELSEQDAELLAHAQELRQQRDAAEKEASGEGCDGAASSQPKGYRAFRKAYAQAHQHSEKDA